MGELPHPEVSSISQTASQVSRRLELLQDVRTSAPQKPILGVLFRKGVAILMTNRCSQLRLLAIWPTEGPRVDRAPIPRHHLLSNARTVTQLVFLLEGPNRVCQVLRRTVGSIAGHRESLLGFDAVVVLGGKAIGSSGVLW